MANGAETFNYSLSGMSEQTVPFGGTVARFKVRNKGQQVLFVKTKTTGGGYDPDPSVILPGKMEEFELATDEIKVYSEGTKVSIIAIFSDAAGGGGSGSDPNAIKSIEIPFSDSNVSSTDTVPQNAVIRKVSVKILTAYDDSKSISVDNGLGTQTFLAGGLVDAETEDLYVFEDRIVWTAAEGTPRVVLSGAGADGDGVAIFDYVETPGS